METTFKITQDPIDAVSDRAQSDSGAVLSFLGVVRDKNDGSVVTAIDYQCYEKMAMMEIERIVAVVAEKIKMQTVTVIHRTGLVRVGEASLLVTVGTVHRAEAFNAVREIVEAFKSDIPIWKNEQYEDGGSKWL